MLSFSCLSIQSVQTIESLNNKRDLAAWSGDYCFCVKLQVMHALDQIQMLRNVKSKQKDIRSL
jgi:hypothetical protein